MFISICSMIDFRLLLIAVAIATVAYLSSISSRVPVVTSIEPVYDYIIGSALKCFASGVQFA